MAGSVEGLEGRVKVLEGIVIGVAVGVGVLVGVGVIGLGYLIVKMKLVARTGD